jgi:serine/threonine kinase 16
MREVEAYRLFAHTPGIIHSVDHAVATERGGGEASKTVYILLPYYRRGNLQDLINANLVNHARFPERRLMQLFLGVCRALRSMHQYRGPGAGAGQPPPAEGMEVVRTDGVDRNVVAAKQARRGGSRQAPSAAGGADEDDESEQQRPLMDQSEEVGAGEVRSYAHRDIKPGMYTIPTPSPHSNSTPPSPPPITNPWPSLQET